MLPEDEAQTALSQAPVKKQKPVRRPLPKHLKRIEKIIDISDEEKSQMKSYWTFIGYDCAEQLAVIPRQHYVIVTKRAKYAPNNDNAPRTENGIKTAAHQMVSLIAKRYQIERQAKEYTAEQRKSHRQEKATRIIEQIKQWLDNKANKVLPKSLLGKAVHYSLNLWPKLTVYLTDGEIPIDNNAAENAICPFVIGRKAWLFSGSPRGARASATLYSLI